MAEEIVRLEDVCKSYNVGQSSQTEILHDVALTVGRGEFMALIGVSGSGKSTLLNIIGLLDRPTSGRLRIKGDDTSTLTEAQITRLRGHAIGFVFQAHHLISAFTALENVMMPMLVDRGFPNAAMRERANDLIARVGLTEVSDNLAGNMSGGQAQRVAIARALAMNPYLVLADEPTANLDSQTGEAILRLMRHMQEQYRISFLFSSHDRSLMKAADDLIMLRDGVIQSIKRKAAPAAVAEGEPASDFEVAGDEHE